MYCIRCGKMFLSIYTPLVAIFGVSTALPLAHNVALREYFVHPSARNVNLHSRIIGGEEAAPHEFPYQVALYANFALGTNFCGGSLVSAFYVITAAHCADGALSIDLVFGAQVISEQENSQIRRTSTEFIIHSGWDRTELINDLALIKLSEPVEENDYIKIIKIASGGDTYAGSKGIIAGWGRTTNNQDGITPVLRYLSGDILSNEQCKSIDPYDSVIVPTHLCLSGLSGDISVGTCNGDSGGPLAVDGVQVGLVSFGYVDCEAGKPSVFTRLTEYTDWIRENSDIEF